MQSLTRINDGQIRSALLFLFGGILAVVSAICSVLLMTEHLTGYEAWLSAAIAIGMVGCQFVFANEVVSLWDKNKAIALVIAIPTLVLFYVSITGSASFLESRFSVTKETNVTTNSEYLELTRQMSDYKAAQKRLEHLADKEAEKGNDWMASQNETKAAEQAANWLEAFDKRSALAPATKTSMEALAALHGESRSISWLSIGFIIDFCPLLAILANHYRKQAVVLIASDDMTILNGMNKSQTGQLTDNLENDMTEKVPSKEVTNSKRINVDDLFHVVSEEIRQGIWGERSVSRSKVCEGHNLKSRPKQIALFKMLEENNVIRLNPESDKTEYLRVTA